MYICIYVLCTFTWLKGQHYQLTPTVWACVCVSVTAGHVQANDLSWGSGYCLCFMTCHKSAICTHTIKHKRTEELLGGLYIVRDILYGVTVCVSLNMRHTFPLLFGMRLSFCVAMSRLTESPHKIRILTLIFRKKTKKKDSFSWYLQTFFPERPAQRNNALLGLFHKNCSHLSRAQRHLVVIWPLWLLSKHDWMHDITSTMYFHKGVLSERLE